MCLEFGGQMSTSNRMSKETVTIVNEGETPFLMSFEWEI